MELRHLRYFIKSAELLHFTAAAAAMHVSQPNLSQQIQQLEDELEAKLFERIGRTVHLTAAGKVFFAHAQKALSEVEAGRQSIHDLNGLLRGTLRIGVTNSLSAELLPEMLAKFVHLHPAIQISVSVGTNIDVEAGVKVGKMDLGLVCRSSKPAAFKSMTLFNEEVLVVVSRKHRLAGLTALRMHHLKGVPLALPTPDVSMRQLIDDAFEKENIQPHIIVETNDIDVLLGFAKQGVAATILTSQATAHLQLSNFSRIHLNEKGFLLTAAFIWPRNGDSSPAARRFLELASRHTYPDRSTKSARTKIGTAPHDKS